MIHEGKVKKVKTFKSPLGHTEPKSVHFFNEGRCAYSAKPKQTFKNCIPWITNPLVKDTQENDGDLKAIDQFLDRRSFCSYAVDAKLHLLKK